MQHVNKTIPKPESKKKVHAMYEMMEKPTAIVFIVGDEILNGRIQDQNGHYMASRLSARGISVRRIVVLPDEMVTVAELVRQWHRRCTYLFTSGGIGPTHDDITRQAIAKALDRPLVRHPEAETVIRAYYGGSINNARLAMADYPMGAELIHNPVTAVPGCIVGNVFVLPGIPEVLQPMFDMLLPRLQAAPIHRMEINTAAYEGEYAKALAGIAVACSSVQIGSYPFLNNPKLRSTITLASADPQKLAEAAEMVHTMLRKWDAGKGWQ